MGLKSHLVSVCCVSATIRVRMTAFQNSLGSTRLYPGDRICKNEIGGECGTCGGGARCIQRFGEETWK